MYTEQSTPNELLHAYIDAELSPELEQQFFSMLASDGELRTRLRQLRGLRTEARRFGAVAAPPPELTGAVFSQLGFQTGPALRPSHLVGAALLLRNAWAPLASAAAAAFLTATIIFGLQGTPSGDGIPTLADRQSNTRIEAQSDTRASDRSSTRDRQSDAGEARATATSQSPANVTAPAPRMRAAAAVDPSFAMQDAAETRVAQAPPVTDGANSAASGTDFAARTEEEASGRNTDETLPTTQTSGELPTLAANAQPDAAIPFSDGVSVSGSGGVTLPSSVRSVPGEDATVLAQQGFPGQDAVDTRGYFPGLSREPVLSFLSIELRGVSAASFPAVTIGTRSNPWMENMAAAVYYTDEQNDFGLEYGQEPFSQHYHGVEFGKQVTYEQNLLTSWLLLGYRHRFAPMIAYGSIEPYITTSFGATIQAWPLARAGFGLMYMPDRRVRFHLGLEGSLLAYPYQNTWFTSKRAGLTYGISLLL